MALGLHHGHINCETHHKIPNKYEIAFVIVPKLPNDMSKGLSAINALLSSLDVRYLTFLSSSSMISPEFCHHKHVMHKVDNSPASVYCQQQERASKLD